MLTVDVGEQYATLAAAAAAPDGATILVDAGTYVNDFATIATKITTEGVGGMASFVATVPPTNFKGILTVDKTSPSRTCRSPAAPSRMQKAATAPASATKAGGWRW